MSFSIAAQKRPASPLDSSRDNRLSLDLQLAPGNVNTSNMHPESEFPFQHRQRLPTSYGLELLCVPLKNDSRIDAPRQGHQAKHGLVVEKRCFIRRKYHRPLAIPGTPG
jgi:hypothetical protein